MKWKERAAASKGRGGGGELERQLDRWTGRKIGRYMDKNIGKQIVI